MGKEEINFQVEVKNLEDILQAIRPFLSSGNSSLRSMLIEEFDNNAKREEGIKEFNSQIDNWDDVTQPPARMHSMDVRHTNADNIIKTKLDGTRNGEIVEWHGIDDGVYKFDVRSDRFWSELNDVETEIEVK